MPNWTYNHLKTSNPEIFPTFLNEKQEFDFEKLFPMPSSLDIESGSITDKAIAYFVTERLTVPVEQTNLRYLISNMFSYNWADEVVSRLRNDIKQGSQKYLDDLYEKGRQYIFNFENYGHYTWYSWCNANWGTKWNALQTCFNENEPLEISFDTAWSAPLPIFTEMCRLFPNDQISFHCEYEEGFVIEFENNNGQLTKVNEYDFHGEDDGDID